MEEIKTKDGFKAQQYETYYLENGQEVILDDFATNSKGETIFMVVLQFEGETMTVNCHSGEYTEVHGTWECESEPLPVESIYKNEPTAKLGKEYKYLSERIMKSIEAHGDLKISIDKSKSTLSKTKREIENIIHSNKELFTQRDNIKKEVAELSEKKDTLIQRNSELSFIISEKEKKDVSNLISKEELLNLRKIEFEMQCLKSAGLDNWEHYDTAMAKYLERFPND
jgi:hypothetical protein